MDFLIAVFQERKQFLDMNYYDLSNQEYYLLAAFGEMDNECKKKV